MAQKNTNGTNGGAPVGFEAKLWATADALRNNMDVAKYEHVVLGLIFLMYIAEWCNEGLPGNKLWRYCSSPAGNANFP